MVSGVPFNVDVTAATVTTVGVTLTVILLGISNPTFLPSASVNPTMPPEVPIPNGFASAPGEAGAPAPGIK